MKADIFKKYAPWVDKARDYEIIDGRALILLGDSAEILSGTTVMTDSAIMDPPYDFDSSGGKLFKRENSYFDKVRGADITDGFDLNILAACALADQMIVFMHNDQLYEILGHLTQPYIQEIAFDPDNGNCYTEPRDERYNRFVLCQWHKDNPMPVANKHYVPDTELYIHVWRAPAYPQGSLADKARYVFNPVSKSVYDHPTIKPQRVMEKCVINASRAGDYVLDPFCGSGSTGVACLRHGRLFIGIEKDPEYYKLAIKRLKTGAGMIPDDEIQASLFNQ